MKYETCLVLFLIIILICILGILSNDIFFNKTFVEGARTLPRPTRHPYIDPDELLGDRPDVLQKSMNKLVDDTVALYFDENNVPYMNTIDTYNNMCVSQGFTTIENKMRLKDLCFYIIDYVIPSLPSVNNPKSTVILPPIEFNSTNFNGYNYNASGIASIATNYWSNNPGPDFDFSGNFGGFGWNDYLDPSSSSTSSSGKNGSKGTNGTTGGNGGPYSSSSCGSCPTSCLASMTCSSNGKSGSNGSSGLNGLGSYDVSASNQYGIPYISPDTIFNIKLQSMALVDSPFSYIGEGGYNITDEPNNYPNPDIGVSPLNNRIMSLFYTYFDLSGGTNAPTPYMLSTMKFLSKNYSPIDDEHKNKLRDLVFYFMENIIPGLPTDPDHPHSYVQWKPIRWLSHSSL